jgi:hypothetical protein
MIAAAMTATSAAGTGLRARVRSPSSFRHSYGYDTLAVGGRFDATPEAFARMTKSLGIESLNNFGVTVSPRMVLDRGVVMWSLRRLASVTRTPRRGRAAKA